MKKSIQQQLSETRQRLEKVEAEYKEFTYIVSHDLNGPMRSIEGFSSILAKDCADKLDERSQGHLNRVLSGVDKSKSILNALLEYSRINTLKNQFHECDCNDIFKNVIAELNELVKASDAEIEAHELPTIVADSAQIMQVFFHLLKNALTFQLMKAPPKIRITSEETENEWTIVFRDNGIGIRSKMLEKVFKPLRRAVKDSDYSGVGIGLAIARKIADRHGGDLRVETKENIGSTFFFSVSKKLLDDDLFDDTLLDSTPDELPGKRAK